MRILSPKLAVVKMLKWITRYRNWPSITLARATRRTPSEVILRSGLKLTAPPDGGLLNLVDEIFFRRVYTPEYLPIGNEDVVVDIGANIGIFTTFASRRTAREVYAFEPFPANVDYIELNAQRNNLSNVTVERIAISDRAGTAKLYLAEIRGGHLLFDHNIRGSLSEYIEVPTTTLQTIVDKYDLQTIGFLKMDCEGSEGAILSATPQDYIARIRKISLEFHDHVSCLTHSELKAILEDAGFETQVVWDGVLPFGYLHGWQTS